MTRRSLRLLVVEDSDLDADLLVHEVSRGGYDLAVTRVENAETLRAALGSESWDLVVTDYALPTFSGLETLAIVREVAPEVPVIVVSGTIDEESAVEALRAGARDFVVKGRLARLLPAIDRELCEVERHLTQDRHRAALQQQLHASEDRARYALAAAGAAVWEFELPSGQMGWSEPLAALFELPDCALEPSVDTFRERLHPDDLSRVDAALARSIQTDAPYRIDFRAARSAGGFRWIASTGRVVRDPAGEPIAMMGIAMDVSERKELEQQLQLLEAQRQADRLRVLRATMRTVQDIVNNNLNQLQLLRLEADGHVPPDTLTLFDATIRDTTAQLTALGNLEVIVEKPMASGPGVEVRPSSVPR